MPQLNPDPWFTIMVISWLIIIALTPIKILPYKNLNNPFLKTLPNSKKPWSWPWP